MMIVHVDMDAFYASIEQRDRPELARCPVIVGGHPDRRGVVAAASYQARQFGVHSAMPAATARRLCPQAVFLPPRIGYYGEVSAQIRKIFAAYTPLVEPLSLDEAFLDVSGSEELFGPAARIGRAIKDEIRDSLQLVASVGIAPNKFLAKIASDHDKPDGYHLVTPDGVRDFLDPLDISRLWGVGHVTATRLRQLGAQTVGDARRFPQPVLEQQFGPQGIKIWELVRGIDKRTVVPDRAAKSISRETTFPQDVADFEILRSILLELTEHIAWRLRQQRLRGSTIFVKTRLSDFRTQIRSRTLATPTDRTSDIWQAATGLLSDCRDGLQQPLRLLGVGVSGLEQPGQRQAALFQHETDQTASRLDVAADQIRARFGSRAIEHGSVMQRRIAKTLSSAENETQNGTAPLGNFQARRPESDPGAVE